MIRNWNVFCLSEAVSPITHMAGVAGNESLVMRGPVVTPRGVRWVPCLSGNAIRHRLVREPGVRWLIDQLGLRGNLTLPQLNYLFHGGNLTQGGGREDTRRIADMQRLFPLLRLLGGSLPDQIIPGSLLAQQGLLVCEENRQTLTAVLPAGWELPSEALRPAESFVSGYQYTRGDARKQPGLAPIDEQKEGDSNLMIFSGQQVTRGSFFVHGFTLQYCSELELGALLLSLDLWEQGGGTVGGQGARGHGKLRTWLHIDGDASGALETYRAHVDAHADDCRRWLNGAFGVAAPSEGTELVQAKKPRGKKAVAT